MFDQTFVNAQAQTRRPWTVGVSLVLQTGLVAVLLIVPLLHVAKLELAAKIQITLPVEHVDLKATPVRQAATRSSAITRPVFRLAVIHAPTIVPKTIVMTPDAPEIGVPVAIGTGAPSMSSILSGLPAAPPAQTVVRLTPPHPPTPPGPVRVSVGVQAAKLIAGPTPLYPPLAKATRIQGTVRIQAIIQRDGAIGHLQVLSGPALLINAAVEAVQKWRYQPTLLNGEPVEVITEIDVNFALN